MSVAEQRGPSIAEVVAQARSTIYRSRLLKGLATWLVTTGAIVLTLLVLDNLLRLPSALRFPLAIAALVVTAASAWKHVIRNALDRKSPAEVAVLLEQKYGIGENVLINSLQFSEAEFGEAQRPFIEETLGAGTLGASSVSMQDLWQPKTLMKWGAVCAAVLLLGSAYTSLAPRHAGNAFSRYLFPLSDVPPVGSVELTVTPASDVRLAEGDKLQITVDVGGLGEGETLGSYPELYWREGSAEIAAQPGDATRVVLQPVVGKPHRYTHTFFRVRRDLAFRVFAADTYSRSTQVRVHAAPRIAEAQFHITPPSYVGAGPRTVMGPPRPVSCLPGSQLGIEIKLDKDASALRWNAGGKSIDFERSTETPLLWHAKSVIEVAGPYDIEVESKELPERIQIASGVISLLADRAPKVEFVQSAMSWSVLPGERVPLRIRAEDDHGVKQIAVTVKSAFAAGDAATVKTWNYEGPPGRTGSIEETMDLTIDAAVFAPGGKYLVEAVCADFCPDNKATVSRPVLIEVKALDNLELPSDSKMRDVYAALDRAITFQKRALDATRTLTSHIDEVWLNISGNDREPDEVKKLLQAHRTQMLGNQTSVRTTLLGVQTSKTVLGDNRLVKRMHELGKVEATLANDQAFESTLPAVKAEVAAGQRRSHLLETGEKRLLLAKLPGKYLALVVRSTQDWQDRFNVPNVAFVTYAKQSLTRAEGLNVQPADGISKVTQTDDRVSWQASGLAPFAIVADLAQRRSLAEIVFASADPRAVDVYISNDKIDIQITPATKEQVLKNLGPLAEVQELIYNELVALKGQEAKRAAKAKDDLAKKALGESFEAPPTIEEEIKKFHDELKVWKKDHEKNANDRKSIMDKAGEDFSDDELDALRKLNMDKRQNGRKLEDMIHSLTNADAMDFADPSMAKTLARLMTDAKELEDLQKQAQKKADEQEYSFNLDKALTSKAEEILKGTNDVSTVMPTPGSSEAPEDKKNIPYLQELPSELAVTVPPLMQKFDSLYEKIKQAGTSLANTPNAADGPIAPSTFSGSSAAGKMGDATPDPKMDRTGRSNVGRTGKSDGQMVGSSAPAIPDEEILIPERMSNSPLDSGSKDIEDKSGNPATSQGLGKSTDGLTEFGRNGLMPAALDKKLRDVMREAEDVRASAHELVMQLQAHNLPTTDLKRAIHRLALATKAMQRGDGVGIRQAYRDSLRHLQNTQKDIAKAFEQRRLQRGQAGGNQQQLTGRDSDDPRGYEDIIGAYFRKIAEK